MQSEILVALISGICVAIPSYLATKSNSNKTIALLEYKIEELRKDVEKHNQVVERMFKAESDIKTLYRQVNKLEKWKDELLWRNGLNVPEWEH